MRGIPSDNNISIKNKKRPFSPFISQKLNSKEESEFDGLKKKLQKYDGINLSGRYIDVNMMCLNHP